mmetsp:Transcript_2225/g.5559  ORF Transcript_2225/g.5559 Transcript_2225/m.5559 type:complete len:96 (-) Transcript_2225:190-477(-)
MATFIRCRLCAPLLFLSRAAGDEPDRSARLHSRGCAQTPAVMQTSSHDARWFDVGCVPCNGRCALVVLESVSTSRGSSSSLYGEEGFQAPPPIFS